MAEIVWGEAVDRVYERGLDQGVLYEYNNGAYTNGVAWNGLTACNESPSGGEPNKNYADNTVYATLFSAEEFGATIEAFTCPPQFFQYDGVRTIGGVKFGQQARGIFGFSYRTLIGNGETEDAGEIIHLVYGAQASPSEKSRSTTNDSPELTTFSWTVTTTPVPVPGGKPTSHVTVDSRDYTTTQMNAIKAILYGIGGGTPRMPLPSELISVLGGSGTSVTPEAPAWALATDTITFTTRTGYDYYVNGIKQDAASTLVITTPTVVEARPKSTYHFPAVHVAQWYFDPA